MSTPKIVAFAGSLRAGSYNKMAVKVAAEGARAAGAEVTFIDLRDYPMPLFDEDLEKAQGMPAPAQKFKDMLIASHGMIISSAEYNSSISAVLKNAIDWASRPGKKPDGSPEAPLAAFAGKVVGLTAASPGALGGLRGLVTVRSILGNIACLVIPEQVAIPKAHEVFNADGTIKDEKIGAMLKSVGSRVAHVAGKLHG